MFTAGEDDPPCFCLPQAPSVKLGFAICYDLEVIKTKRVCFSLHLRPSPEGSYKGLTSRLVEITTCVFAVSRRYRCSRKARCAGKEVKKDVCLLVQILCTP